MKILALFIFFLFTLQLTAQSFDFNENSSYENIDYFSFYPSLLLKHNINSFYKLPKNPVHTVSLSGWDSEDVADPYIHVTADSIYLYYDGSYKNHYTIGYAVRDQDGWFWINRKQILSSDKIQWRSYHLIDPTIVPGKQLLLYNGNKDDNETGYKIGLAKRNKQWVFQSSKPLVNLNSASWDYSGNAYQDVVYIPERKIYKMWYSGFTGPFAHIGLMESKNGVKWKKVGRKPVFQSSPGVTSPEVVYNGESYTMYFTQLDLNQGFGTKIASVKSNDGITWQDKKDILMPEDRWEGNRLMSPNLSYFESQIHLYYCAQNGSQWNIGEAIAESIFETSGKWVSKEIKEKLSKIIIKYEQPPQTDILVQLINNQENAIPLNLSKNKKGLRTNVFQADLDVTISPPYKIGIQLKTENENMSPQIFELVLKK